MARRRNCSDRLRLAGGGRDIHRLWWGHDGRHYVRIEQGLSRLGLSDLPDGVAGLDGADTRPVPMTVKPDQAIGSISGKLPALLCPGAPLSPGPAVQIVLNPPLPDIDIAIRCPPPHGAKRWIVHPERPRFVVADQRIAGQNCLNLISTKRVRLERGGVVAGVMITAPGVARAMNNGRVASQRFIPTPV